MKLSLILWSLVATDKNTDQIEEVVQKETAKAKKNYDKDEHGKEGNFVGTYVAMSLDKIIEDYLEQKGMKLLPKKHVGTTYQGAAAVAAARQKELSAVALVEDVKGDGQSFDKHKIECNDMALYPHIYEPKRICSPVPKTNCFREHLPNFEGPKSFDLSKCPKDSITLNKESSDVFGKDQYVQIVQLANRIKDQLSEKIKSKTISFAGATFEPSSKPLAVDGARATGADYSASFLLDGALTFRSTDVSHTAKKGLVMWSSGLENVFEGKGPRIQLQFTCNPDFAEESLLEKIAKRPGKGKVINESLKGDWRLWSIFVFVLCWMFRF